ncbi:MAG: DUF6441 family protein [Pseudomonadota bacterium]
MRFTMQQPVFGKALAGTEKAIERAVTSGMRDAVDELKDDLREQVLAAGLGDRLARTWRGKVFPETGESIEAAAFVWSRAPKLIDAFDRGVTIRSARGLFLAIPTPAAGAVGQGASGKRERTTPAGWERRTRLKLRFVYRRGRPSLLVVDDARLTGRGLAARNKRRSGQATVVVFILVPQVSLRKRLNVESTARKQAARVAGYIARHWTLA